MGTGWYRMLQDTGEAAILILQEGREQVEMYCNDGWRRYVVKVITAVLGILPLQLASQVSRNVALIGPW